MKPKKKKTIKDFFKKYESLEIEYSHYHGQGSHLNRHIDTQGDPHNYYRQYEGKIIVDEQEAGEVYFTIFDYDKMLSDGMNVMEVADEHSQQAYLLFLPLYDEENEELYEPMGDIGGRILFLENMILKPAYRGYGLGELVENDILDVYGNKVCCLLLKTLPLQSRMSEDAAKNPYRLDKLNADIEGAQESLNAYVEKRGYQKIDKLATDLGDASSTLGCSYIKILDVDWAEEMEEKEDGRRNNLEYAKKVKKQLESYINRDMEEQEARWACLKIIDLLTAGVLNDSLKTPDELNMLMGGRVKEATMGKVLPYLDFLGLISTEFWYEKEGTKFQMNIKDIDEANKLGIYLHEGREIADTNYDEHLRIYIRRNKDSIL